MKTTTMAAALFLGVLGFAVSGSAFAQSSLGGARLPQNKIGGAAKPAPMVGGAAIPPGSVRPAPIVGTIKPASPAGKPTLGGIGNTMASQTPGMNPPVTPPKNTLVTPPNLKCSSGACVARGSKP
jgi:hypothetical protein